MNKKEIQLFLRTLELNGDLTKEEASFFYELFICTLEEQYNNLEKIQLESKSLFSNINNSIKIGKENEIIEACKEFEGKKTFRDIIEHPVKIENQPTKKELLNTFKKLDNKWFAVPYPPVNMILRLLTAIDERRKVASSNSWHLFFDFTFRFLRELNRLFGFVYYPSRNDLVHRMTQELSINSGETFFIASTPSLAFYNEFQKWGESSNLRYLKSMSESKNRIFYIMNKETIIKAYKNILATKIPLNEFIDSTADHLIKYGGSPSIGIFYGELNTNLFGKGGNISMYSRDSLMFTVRNSNGGLCALCHERSLDSLSSIIPLVGLRNWMDFWNGLRNRAPQDLKNQLYDNSKFLVLKNQDEELTKNKAISIVNHIINDFDED